ncbi:hypothetical protein SK3146_03445 [Paenibacillus konkukensis]|uniref:LysM domain-containing protein n=1 Tax=Paenibacillus konkukensis TaxID=2020716 RepID=A0ABY4RQE0_9BACL|nr:hypothetical protein [Paenibacillus konkukensis]UQZ84212.1 hypothetical protein SK3146_03445 [Paenibacillus konkukensis]
MKTIGQKLIAGTIAATFVLGAGFAGLHNQAQAAAASDGTAATAAKGAGKQGPGGFGGERGMQRGGGFHGANLTKQTATLLGVEESTIQAALKEGKTLAEIAQNSGLSEADYLAKLVAAQTEEINAQVTAGKLTQDQADKQISGLSDRLKSKIENTGPAGGPQGEQGQPGQENGGPGRGGMPMGGPGLLGNSELLTSILGITQDELRTEQEAGKTIAEIAAAQGIGEDDLIAKLKDGLTDTLKQFVEAKHQKPEQAPADDAAGASDAAAE